MDLSSPPPSAPPPYEILPITLSAKLTKAFAGACYNGNMRLVKGITFREGEVMTEVLGEDYSGEEVKLKINEHVKVGQYIYGTPFYLACTELHEEVVDFLIQEFGELIEFNPNPFITLCGSGPYKSPQATLKVMDLIVKCPRFNINAEDGDGYTALMAACLTGNYPAAAFILDYPPKPGTHLSTSVFVSSTMMDDDCDIEKLAKLHDVDLSHINKEGENCLHIVMHAFGSNEDTSVILARKKILTMLLGHFSMTKEILNAPVEGMDYTPAHYAANANSIDLFEIIFSIKNPLPLDLDLMVRSGRTDNLNSITSTILSAQGDFVNKKLAIYNEWLAFHNIKQEQKRTAWGLALRRLVCLA